MIDSPTVTATNTPSTVIAVICFLSESHRKISHFKIEMILLYRIDPITQMDMFLFHRMDPITQMDMFLFHRTDPITQMLVMQLYDYRIIRSLPNDPS